MIDANIQLVHGLVAVVDYEPEIDQEQLRPARRAGAARRERDPQHRRRTRTSSSGACYPLEGNEAVFGVDYRDLPQQLPSGLLARDLGVTVLAGPLDLIQGGRGSSRDRRSSSTTPGPGAERFWGLLSTVIDAAALYPRAGL